MLPYLRKFHTHQSPSTEPITDILDRSNQDDALESGEGPVQTSFSETNDLDKAWYEAWSKIMKDVKYEGKDIGGLAHPASIDPRTRTRSSATSAYYTADVSARPNLRVLTDALVSKVVLERKDDENVATGVEFVSKSGEVIIINATKEVILSAGTMKSPQILELSGMGSSILLAQHGIKAFVDNPNVGENLQDHLIISVSFEAADGVQTGEIMIRDSSIMPALMEMHQKDHSGPLGHHFVPMAQFRLPETFGPNGKDYIPALLREVSSKPTSEYQQLQESITADLLSSATMQHMIAKMQFNISAGSKISEMVTGFVEGNYLSFMCALNHPFSCGNIHIASSSPTADPLIDPKFLSHPMDIELCARHVQFLSTLMSTAPLSYFLKPNGRRIPAYTFPNGKKEMDLETAKRVVREHSISNYHPAGTCMMGRREDGGVVDGELKVYGVKELRVVDASVFPILPRGNIITSVYAVAERAADMIKAEWKGK